MNTNINHLFGTEKYSQSRMIKAECAEHVLTGEGHIYK